MRVPTNNQLRLGRKSLRRSKKPNFKSQIIAAKSQMRHVAHANTKRYLSPVSSANASNAPMLSIKKKSVSLRNRFRAALKSKTANRVRASVSAAKNAVVSPLSRSLNSTKTGFRRFLSRKARHINASAKTIQKSFRGFSARKNFATKKAAATNIQRVYRGYVARSKAMRMKHGKNWIPGNANLKIPGSGTRNVKFHMAIGTGKVKKVSLNKVDAFLSVRPNPGERNLLPGKSRLYAWRYVFDRNMKPKGLEYITTYKRKSNSSSIKEEHPLNVMLLKRPSMLPRVSPHRKLPRKTFTSRLSPIAQENDSPVKSHPWSGAKSPVKSHPFAGSANSPNNKIPSHAAMKLKKRKIVNPWTRGAKMLSLGLLAASAGAMTPRHRTTPIAPWRPYT